MAGFDQIGVLARVLNVWRTAWGLSIEQLAIDAGIATNTVRDVCNAKRLPQQRTLRKFVALFLRMDLRDVAGQHIAKWIAEADVLAKYQKSNRRSVRRLVPYWQNRIALNGQRGVFFLVDDPSKETKPLDPYYRLQIGTGSRSWISYVHRQLRPLGYEPYDLVGVNEEFEGARHVPTAKLLTVVNIFTSLNLYPDWIWSPNVCEYLYDHVIHPLGWNPSHEPVGNIYTVLQNYGRPDIVGACQLRRAYIDDVASYHSRLTHRERRELAALLRQRQDDIAAASRTADHEFLARCHAEYHLAEYPPRIRREIGVHLLRVLETAAPFLLQHSEYLEEMGRQHFEYIRMLQQRCRTDDLYFQLRRWRHRHYAYNTPCLVMAHSALA